MASEAVGPVREEEQSSEEETYDVFVSFTPSDAEWVRGYLLAGFDRAGVNYLSEDDFLVGSARLHEIDRAARRCARIVVVLSPAYLTDSHSQFVDMLFQSEGIRNNTWPLLPVIRHPVDLPPRFGALVTVAATEPAEWENALRQLCQAMARDLPPVDALPPCPYPGMRPFRQGEHRYFFGREAEVDDLLARVVLGAQRCLTVTRAPSFLRGLMRGSP